MSSPLRLVPLLALLAGCVSQQPLELSADHPANPAASAGFMATPEALAAYRSAEEFGAAKSRAPGDGMGGMNHAMPGMGHGAMSHGAMGHGSMTHGSTAR